MDIAAGPFDRARGRRMRGVASATRRALREPLLHFLLIGGLLFGADAATRETRSPAPAPQQIRLTIDDLGRLALLFQAQWRREPTPDEFARMIESRVQAEILYREALAIGLDRDDEIVKRRMAQKMQFLAEDVAASREPTPSELQGWLAENRARFTEPPRLGFRHLYFSPDRRGGRARDDAVAALARLAGEAQDTPRAAALADPFMFQDYYRDRTPEFLGREFGPPFALAVAKLAPGAWHGPIESGLGWHLVFVDTVIAGRAPDFEEIEEEVKTAWLTERKAQAWAKSYAEMRARYTVLLPAPGGEPAMESVR